MPLPNWPMRPANYEDHKAAGTTHLWDSSKARKLSMTPPSKAQYNPHRLKGQAIIDLERACIVPERAVSNLNNTALKQHKFYVDCREYFQDPDFIAGYCDGEFTPYVLVKWCSSGFFHGQPATVAVLKRHGARNL